MVQALDRVLTSYRIGDPHGTYPIFDATGSTLHPGRWNTPASPMIYTSEHYSTAMLEKLVHGSGQLPDAAFAWTDFAATSASGVSAAR